MSDGRDLGSLLRILPGPPEHLVDLDRIERRMFAGLDACRPLAAQVIVARIADFWQSFVRAPVAVTGAVAAAAILVCSTAYLGFFRPAFVSRPHARMVHMEGSVLVRDALNDTWKPLTQLAALTQGQSLRTDAGASLAAVVPPGTGFLLSGGSLLTVSTLRWTAQEYFLAQGKITVRLRSAAGKSSVAVQTPNAVCVAVGTLFEVAVDNANAGAPVTELAVMEGKVKITSTRNPELSRIVSANEKISFVGDKFGDPVRYRESSPRGENEFIDLMKLPRAHPVRQTGFISISSEPAGASVFIDGGNAGKTPLLLEKEPGAYVVSIARDGFTTWNNPIRIAPKKTEVVYAQLNASGDEAAQERSFEEKDGAGGAVATGKEEQPALAGATDASAEPANPAAGPTVASSSAAPGAGGVRRAAIDTFRIAGKLLGVNLYWQRNDIMGRILADTLGWKMMLTRYLQTDIVTAPSPAGAALLARDKGKQFIKLGNPTTMSLAIIQDMGYPLLLLTQWSGAIDLPDSVSYQAKIEDENILSSFLWETIDSFSIEKPTRTILDYRIRVHYLRGGCSDYLGKEVVPLSRAQILCTTGFSLREKVLDYIPEQNLYRIVVACYIIADSGKKTTSINTEIGNLMDKLKLDLSYKPPSLTIVK